MKRFCVALIVLFTILAAWSTAARSAPVLTNPRIDPGVSAAVDREMKAFENADVQRFLSDFTPDAIVIDDSKPLFISGQRAIHDWFVENRAGGGTVTLTRLAATDYTLTEYTAFAAVPFTLTLSGPNGKFVASGTWTGTFKRQAGDTWKIRSLTIAILTTRQ